MIEDAAHAAEAPTAAASSAGSPRRPASASTRRRTSPRARAALVATNSDEVADAIRNLRLMRRGDGSLYDITVPGYKANLSDVLAAIALVQLDKLADTAAQERQFALYDEGLAGLDGIEPLARPARRACAPPVRRPDRRRSPRAHARRGAARTRGRADLDLDPLPARAPADLVPRALPRAAVAAGCRARGRRDLSLPLSPAHSDEDIADVIAALGRPSHHRSACERSRT